MDASTLFVLFMLIAAVVMLIATPFVDRARRNSRHETATTLIMDKQPNPCSIRSGGSSYSVLEQATEVSGSDREEKLR